MLKGGLIGMGRMGITHFSILNAHPLVHITSVCDQSKTMLHFFDKYVGVKTFTEYEKMLNESELDFVLVSTPTESHARLIKAAIQKGLHVFTEKPLALSINDGQEIIELLKNRPVVNQVGYVNRFNEVFVEVKRMLDANVIGQIKNFKFEMMGSTVTKDAAASWRAKRSHGGGCMYEFASHCIDLVVYLIGQPNRIYGSVLQSVFSSNVEDVVSSTFLYDNGCFGNIMVNWSDSSARKPINRIEIFGRKGKIIADKHAFKVYLKEDDEHCGFHAGWNTRYITDMVQNVYFYVRGNEFSLQLDYFVQCIEQRSVTNRASFEEALKTDVLINEIFRNGTGVK